MASPSKNHQIIGTVFFDFKSRTSFFRFHFSDINHQYQAPESKSDSAKWFSHIVPSSSTSQSTDGQSISILPAPQNSATFFTLHQQPNTNQVRPQVKTINLSMSSVIAEATNPSYSVQRATSSTASSSSTKRSKRIACSCPICKENDKL